MKLPAYGKALWQRRLLNERPRVAQLIVGNFWRKNLWIKSDIPRLAVKTTPWHTPQGERYDWRVVAGMDVIAIDARDADEREAGPGGWDAWLWLLAEVHRYATAVWMVTPTIALPNPQDPLSPEADLEVYAFLNCAFDRESNEFSWPPWWPYADAIHLRREPSPAAA
jgi:hypothetical protein